MNPDAIKFSQLVVDMQGATPQTVALAQVVWAQALDTERDKAKAIKARELLESARKNDPKVRPQQAQLGSRTLTRGRWWWWWWCERVHLLQSTLPLGPLANLAKLSGDFEVAIELYEKLLSADPSDASSAFNLAQCYEYADRWDDAIEVLTNYTKK